jgi:putative ABC transport system substrate-binding protein
VNVERIEDVDLAFETVQAWSAGALLLAGGQTYRGAVTTRVSDLAAEHHLPVMFQALVAVTESGGLMAFESDTPAEWRQVAEYVDKILRGATAADLPVQEPRQYDFIVNVKAAQALGITFSPDAAAQVTQWVDK